MLADHDRQLLTAFVDGQLTPAEKRQFERLLQESEEARQLLRRLQEDAWALKALPRVSPRLDLAHSILGQIHDRKFRPQGARPPASPPPLPPPLPSNVMRPGRISPGRPFPPALPDHRPEGLAFAKPPRGRVWVACAASLLLLVCAASYAFFAYLTAPSGPPALVHQNPEDPTGPGKVPGGRPDQGSGLEDPDGQDEEVPVAPPGTLKGPPAIPPAVAKRPPRAGRETALAYGPGDEPSLPSALGPAVLAGPGGGMELFNPETVDAVLPQIFSVGALDRAEERQKLFDHLAQGEAFRLELLCTNSSLAFQWVRAALAAEKVAVSVDALAALHLKQPQVPGGYALYAEGVTARKLVDALARVGASHRDGLAKKPQIDLRLRGPLVVAPLTRDDHKALTALLGFDPLEDPDPPEPAAPPATGKPMRPDPREELSEVTARQVAQALQGRGTPRPTLGGPRALALPYPLNRAATRSAEVQQFREGRKPLRTDTLRVFLVLRTTG